ncbi:MAG: hypothetical protein HA493_05170 [Candidatus Verstraetearchaeota archaeon]|nr:hypothetical protein [Candidatus Verstraetearchaeota archaeon]
MNETVTKVKEEMTSFERIEAMYKGEATDRVVIGWVRAAETGRFLPQISVADVVRDKTGYYLYRGIKTLYDRYQTDIITPYTYTTIEAVAMGTKVKYFTDQLPAPIEYAIKSPEDLDRIKIPDPRVDGDLPCLYNCTKRLARDYGNKAIISLGTAGPFSVASRIRGLWQIAYDIVRRPWFAHDIINIATEACINIIEGWYEAGATATISGAGSETTLGIEHFKQFVVPYERRYLRKAKKIGFLSFLRHICSGPSASVVIDIFKEFGLDLLPTLVWGYYDSPEIMLQKKKFFAEYFPMVAVGGYIKAAETLALSTPEVITKEVEHVIKMCAPGGKYVHIADCCIPPTVPLENLDAFIFTAKKMGRVY